MAGTGRRLSWQDEFSTSCRKGQVEHAQNMIAGVDESQEKTGYALYTASGYGMDGLVQTLLKLNVEPSNACDQDGSTALHRAATNGHLATTSILIKAGADVNAQTTDGSTPLHLASRGGHADVIHRLIGHADVNAITQDGSSALHFAACNGHCKVVQILVDAKADTSLASKDKTTPLHCAAVLGNLDIIGILLKAGASPQVADQNGYTPLHIAAKHGYSGVLEVLLTKGASPWERTAAAETPLHLAASSQYSAAISVLLTASKERQVEIKRKDSWCLVNSKGSFLQEERLGTLEQLEEESGNLLLLNQDGKAALHIAVEKNSYSIAQDLLRAGMNVNVLDSRGWTPLHYAANLNSTEMIRLLLDHGAKLHAKTPSGETPKDLALRHGRYCLACTCLEKATYVMELLQYGTVECEDVAIAVGGAPGAGKSTFVDSFNTTLVGAIFRYENSSDRGARDATTRTRGIRLVSVEDRSLRHTKHFMDFGGHDEFIPAHSLFLSESSTPSLAVTLVDGMLIKTERNTLRTQLEQWCGVFVSCNRRLPRRHKQPSLRGAEALSDLPDRRMPILVVVSRGKELSEHERGQVMEIYSHVCKKFFHYLDFERQPWFLDCRKSHDSLMTGLRNRINDIANRLVRQAGDQPRIVQIIRGALHRVRKELDNRPFCQRSHFTKTLLEILANDSTANDTMDFGTSSASQVIEPALRLLSCYGELITFESAPLKDTVVINPSWLLTQVVGHICSPYFFPQPHIVFQRGRALKADVVKSLSELQQPGGVVLDMLAQLGLCIIDGEDIIVPSKLPPMSETGAQLGSWLEDEKWTKYAGMRFSCEESIPLSAGFVVLLQTRVFSAFKRHQGMTPKLFLRCVNAYPCQSEAQGAVVVHPTRLTVDVVVRGPKGSQRDLFALLHLLCHEVRETAEQYSPGTVLCHHVLSSSELRRKVRTGGGEFPAVTYRPGDVLEAVRGNLLMDHPDRETSDRALDLLHLLPTHIHLISKESLDMLCALMDGPSDRDWCHCAEMLGFNALEVQNMMQRQPQQEEVSKTKLLLQLWAMRSPNNTVNRLLECFESQCFGHVEIARILREELQKPFLGTPNLFMARKAQADLDKELAISHRGNWAQESSTAAASGGV